MLDPVGETGLVLGDDVTLADWSGTRAADRERRPTSQLRLTAENKCGTHDSRDPLGGGVFFGDGDKQTNHRPTRLLSRDGLGAAVEKVVGPHKHNGHPHFPGSLRVKQ